MGSYINSGGKSNQSGPARARQNGNDIVAEAMWASVAGSNIFENPNMVVPPLPTVRRSAADLNVPIDYRPNPITNSIDYMDNGAATYAEKVIRSVATRPVAPPSVAVIDSFTDCGALPGEPGCYTPPTPYGGPWPEDYLAFVKTMTPAERKTFLRNQYFQEEGDTKFFEYEYSKRMKLEERAKGRDIFTHLASFNRRTLDKYQSNPDLIADFILHPDDAAHRHFAQIMPLKPEEVRMLSGEKPFRIVRNKSEHIGMDLSPGQYDKDYFTMETVLDSDVETRMYLDYSQEDVQAIVLKEANRVVTNRERLLSETTAFMATLVDENNVIYDRVAPQDVAYFVFEEEALPSAQNFMAPKNGTVEGGKVLAKAAVDNVAEKTVLKQMFGKAAGKALFGVDVLLTISEERNLDRMAELFQSAYDYGMMSWNDYRLVDPSRLHVKADVQRNYQLAKLGGWAVAGLASGGYGWVVGIAGVVTETGLATSGINDEIVGNYVQGLMDYREMPKYPVPQLNEIPESVIRREIIRYK